MAEPSPAKLMYQALERITRYQSPDELRQSSVRDYGLDYLEALEMVYENIQEEARAVLARIIDTHIPCRDGHVFTWSGSSLHDKPDPFMLCECKMYTWEQVSGFGLVEKT